MVSIMPEQYCWSGIRSFHPQMEHALAAGDTTALTFETEAVLNRVEELGDLFADTLAVRQTLPDL